MHRTLIEVSQLVSLLGQPDLRLLDCRYELTQPGAGRARYEAGHLPGALYADLHHDLSGPPVTNRGRHPLPLPEALRATFGRWGIGPRTQVVVYDDSGGCFAARAWWLLGYMGHEAVAVLNGGWQAWLAATGPLSDAPASVDPVHFQGAPHPERVVGIDEVEGAPRLVDAREGPRFRGEFEPLDPKAGHIPGAVNRFWKDNLDASGCFLAPRALRSAFEALLGDVPPGGLVSYCGSGVTACHNLLAMAHAGLPAGRLYGGSWSEWSGTPGRPVATGP